MMIMIKEKYILLSNLTAVAFLVECFLICSFIAGATAKKKKN